MIIIVVSSMIEVLCLVAYYVRPLSQWGSPDRDLLDVWISRRLLAVNPKQQEY